jgi:23S rRNA (uracil1939-C5)-methyltransferase
MELTITALSNEGDGVARTEDGMCVFVAGTAPGDVIEATLTKQEKTFARATIEKVLTPGPGRITPACPYAGLCGGCPWAHLDYPTQATAKRAQVVEALTRLGRLAPEEADALVAPLVSPGEPWGYRNKIELGVSRDRAGKTRVGMHAAGGTNVIAVKQCLLLEKRYQSAVKNVAGALSFLENQHHLGIYRVGIRASVRTRQLEVALWSEPGAWPRGHVAKVVGAAVDATSIVRVLTKGPAKARKVTGVEVLGGAGNWEELIAGGRMRVSAPSFFQVNTKGAEKLVELALAGLAPASDDLAMDLYSGAGTFTLPLARTCDFVDAVESYGPSVRDLRRNLELANITNVDCVGGDANLEFPDDEAAIIVVDPPRKGLAPEVVTKLSAQPARAIAYVSCNPATLARDLKRFREVGTFAATSVTPVDLFPQTPHVECVTILKRA